MQNLQANAALVHTGGTVLKFRLAPGDTGIFQTLAAMEALARHAAQSTPMRKLAALMLTIKPSDAHLDKETNIAITIYQTMRFVLKFQDDPLGVEFVRDPAQLAAHVLDNLGSSQKTLVDCDDASTFAASVALAMGVHAAFIVVSRPGEPSGDFVHVLPAVLLADGSAYAIDSQERIPVGHLPPFGRAAVWRVLA